MQVPLTVGKKVPLTPQVAVGLPEKPGAQFAAHTAPTPIPLQLGLHPVLLPGTGGKLLFEHTAKHNSNSRYRYFGIGSDSWLTVSGGRQSTYQVLLQEACNLLCYEAADLHEVLPFYGTLS